MEASQQPLKTGQESHEHGRDDTYASRGGIVSLSMIEKDALTPIYKLELVSGQSYWLGRSREDGFFMFSPAY